MTTADANDNWHWDCILRFWWLFFIPCLCQPPCIIIHCHGNGKSRCLWFQLESRCGSHTSWIFMPHFGLLLLSREFLALLLLFNNSFLAGLNSLSLFTNYPGNGALKDLLIKTTRKHSTTSLLNLFSLFSGKFLSSAPFLVLRETEGKVEDSGLVKHTKRGEKENFSFTKPMFWDEAELSWVLRQIPWSKKYFHE